MTEAETERAAVVAWLRWQANDCRSQQANLPHWQPEWLYLREQVETFHVAADAIEAGEHLTNEGK